MKIKGVWGFGNQLLLSHGLPIEGKKAENRVQSEVGSDKGIVHSIQWNVDIHDSVMRDLVSQSIYVFKKVQEASITFDKSNPQFYEQLLAFSHEYRSIMEASYFEMQNQLENLKKEKNEIKDRNKKEIKGIERYGEKERGRERYGEEERGRERNGEEEKMRKRESQLEDQLKVMSICELIWSLLELFFINPNKDLCIMSELMKWYGARFKDDDSFTEISMETKPETHPLYWDMIYSLILKNRIEEARGLLCLHSPSNHSPLIQRMILLLSNMPNINGSNYKSFGEMEMKWKQWNLVCEELKEDQFFSNHPQLFKISRILSGEVEILLEMSHLLPTWYCFLLSKIFFSNPFLPSSDLKLHASFCIEKYGGRENLTPFDRIILSVVELDVQKSLTQTCQLLSNWWFPCHLTDLLTHANVISNKLLPFGSDLREYMLLEYASSLLSHPSLIETACYYFASCPQFGSEYIKEIIIRKNGGIHKPISFCIQSKLIHQERIIYRERGMCELLRGMYVEALSYCIKAKDSDFATLLVNRILSECEYKELLCLEILLDKSDLLLFNTQLVFLGKIVECEIKIENGEEREGLNCLLPLIKERPIPPCFINLLIILFEKIIIMKNIKINEVEAFNILYLIDDFELYEIKRPEVEKNFNIKEKISYIRKNLADILAQNFI